MKQPKLNPQVIKTLLLFLLGAVIVCLFAIALWRTVDAHLLSLAVLVIPRNTGKDDDRKEVRLPTMWGQEYVEDENGSRFEGDGEKEVEKDDEE